MKKFIIIIIMALCGLTAYAENVMLFRTTKFASADIYNGQYYWGNWQKSDLLVSMDVINDIITVHSKYRQTYYVMKHGETYNDPGGGQQVMLYVIDQDKDQGTVRLRIDRNGTAQIYVDFTNMAWVYNVVRIN